MSIPDEDQDLWLGICREMDDLKNVEVSMAAALEPSPTMALLQQEGGRITHIRSLIPDGAAPYLTEEPVRGRPDVADHLESLIRDCGRLGVYSVSLEMGLERARPHASKGDPRDRAGLLKSLLPCLDRVRVTACVHVRYPPPYPASREWANARKLIRQVRHPCCRLAVDVHIDELPDDFAPATFVKDFGFAFGVVRAHYDPRENGEISDRTHRQWARALKGNGYRRALVLCPQAREEANVRTECQRIARWSTLYAGTYEP